LVGLLGEVASATRGYFQDGGSRFVFLLQEHGNLVLAGVLSAVLFLLSGSFLPPQLILEQASAKSPHDSHAVSFIPGYAFN